MADGVKATVGQFIRDVGEAAVKPVVDEVVKAIEEGAQSVTGTGQFSQNPPNPTEQQKKKLEEQKRIDYSLKVIEWNNQIAASQQQVRQENQQKISQQTQEEEEKKKVRQFEVVERQEQQQQMSQAQLQERKAEIKRGVGG